jgi:hypothetical protein
MIRLSFFFLFLTISLNLHSTPFVNTNPDDGDDYDDLYDYGYGKTPSKVTEKTYSCVYSTGGGTENNSGNLGDCKSTTQASRNLHKSNHNCPSSAGCVYTNEALTILETSELRNRGQYGYYYKYTGQSIVRGGTTFSYTHTTIIGDEVDACPAESDPRYKVSGYMGAALLCFEQADLNTRDSCPDSTQDGAYILPSDGTGNSSICKKSDDGSSCQYDASADGTYYVSNFENSCYENNGLPDFDETTAIQPDEDGPECQTLGSVDACLANEDDVCSGGICPSGCGNVALGDSDPVFVCLSGDADGDGVPDYNDPDKDGDGIKNEDDLDADGDGIDDPITSNKSTLEGLVASSNTLLASINKGIGNISGGGSGTPLNTEGVEEGVTASLSKISFLTESGGRTAEAFDSLYAQEDIDEIKAQVLLKQEEYLQVIDDIQTEAKSLFTLTTPSVAFESKTLSISGRSYNISLDRFASTFSLMGTVVLFLAALGSLAILLGNQK